MEMARAKARHFGLSSECTSALIYPDLQQTLKKLKDLLNGNLETKCKIDMPWMEKHTLHTKLLYRFEQLQT